MASRRTHRVAMAFGAAVVMLALPAKLQACACLDRLFGWGRAPALTTYRAPYVPSAAVPASSTVSVPTALQTCRYVPQTCYRTVYRRVPVTTYRAVAGYDPCTGCPTTSCLPVTTWARVAHLVPYTTYRLAYTPVAPPVSYGPCAPYGTAVVSGLGTSSICPSGTCAPAITSGTPYLGPSGSTPPSLKSTAPQPTFEQEENGSTESLKPVPDPEIDSTGMPRLIDPHSRTTSQPVPRPSRFHLIASPPAPINDGGWRASRD